MTIDTHVYVWSHRDQARPTPVPWVPHSLRDEARSFALSDIDADLARSDVSGVVLVQAINSLQHTEDLLAEAALSTRPVRVVGWLPLDQPAEVERLVEHYAGSPLVGVRHLTLHSDVWDLLIRSEVSRSLDIIAAAGLTLDFVPRPDAALAILPTVAQQHPRLPIVINVLGWPRIGEQRMQPWADRLWSAAAEPNVHIKVSGLDRTSGYYADPSFWRPYVSTAITLFGSERIMIGSDWPAVTAFGRDYGDALTAIREAFADLTTAERADIEWRTARRFYRFE